MAFNMSLTLLIAWRGRFSKTAGSHPGHPEARGYRGDDSSAATVCRRRLSDDGAERPAERTQAGEADVDADTGDREVGRAQQIHRALDAAPLQVTVRRLAERRSKRADEVRFRGAGKTRQGGHVERFAVGTVHRVPGTEQSAIRLLRDASHAKPATGCGT